MKLTNFVAFTGEAQQLKPRDFPTAQWHRTGTKWNRTLQLQQKYNKRLQDLS